MLKKSVLVGAMALALIAGTSGAVVPAEAAPVERQELVTASPAAYVNFSREPVGGVLRAENLNPQEWVDKTLADAGVALPVAVRVVPAGSVCGNAVAHGCTRVQRYSDGSSKVLDIWIAADIVYTGLGKHVVLHEAGHALGNYSECSADTYAVRHGSSPEFNRC